MLIKIMKFYSHSKVAEEGSDVLSPLVIALDNILHLEQQVKSYQQGVMSSDTGNIKFAAQLLQQTVFNSEMSTTWLFFFFFTLLHVLQLR